MKLLPLTPLAPISPSNKGLILGKIRGHILDLNRAPINLLQLHILDMSRGPTNLDKTTMEVSSLLQGVQCTLLNKGLTLQGNKLDPLQVNTLRIGRRRRGLCRTAWRRSAVVWQATVPAK
jgi:hypothetical protein